MAKWYCEEKTIVSHVVYHKKLIQLNQFGHKTFFPLKKTIMDEIPMKYLFHL